MRCALILVLVLLVRPAFASCTIAPVEFDATQVFNCDAGASLTCNGTGGAGLAGATHAQNLDATVTGTCVGTPTVQLVNALSTSSVLLGPFTASNTSGSNWEATSAAVPVRLGWYVAQWYDSGASSTKYTASNKWGVGLRFLFNGQSNSVNMYNPNFCCQDGTVTPSANIAIFDGVNWLNTRVGGPGTATPTGNGAIEFCNRISAATGVNCAYAAAAFSGAPITYFELIDTTATYTSGDVHVTVASSTGMSAGAGGGVQFLYGPGFTGAETIMSISGNVLTLDVAPTSNGTSTPIQVIGDAYKTMITNTHLVGGFANWGNDFAGVVWLQGESDAGGGSDGSGWQSKFGNVIGPFTTLSGRSKILFGVATLGDDNSGFGIDVNWEAIRNATHAVVAQYSSQGAYGLGDTADFPMDSSHLHHSPTVYTGMGDRWAQATLNALGVSGYDNANGPTLSVLLKQSTTALCFQASQNNGTSLQDTNGNTAGTLITPGAFRAFDNASPMTLSSPLFSGNKVCFTAGSYNTSHTITGDYLWGANASINSDVLTYDNAPPLGLTAGGPGLPLRPSFGSLTGIIPPITVSRPLSGVIQ